MHVAPFRRMVRLVRVVVGGSFVVVVVVVGEGALTSSSSSPAVLLRGCCRSRSRLGRIGHAKRAAAFFETSVVACCGCGCGVASVLDKDDDLDRRWELLQGRSKRLDRYGHAVRDAVLVSAAMVAWLLASSFFAVACSLGNIVFVVVVVGVDSLGCFLLLKSLLEEQHTHPQG